MQLRNATSPLTSIFLACALGCSAGASDQSDVATTIKATLQSRFPDVKIIDVRAAPMPSWYEVYTGDAIAYSDEKGQYLLMGSLLETSSKRNLTTESLDARHAIDFKTLPLEHAIKVVKGNGKRQLAVFSDPDCPYCQKLEKEIATLTDVTVYTFLYPIPELHPEANRKARDIWCAADRSQAWSQWMLEQKSPAAAAQCKDDPLEELQALAQKLYVTGTPTLFLGNGRKLGGALSAAELDKLL